MAIYKFGLEVTLCDARMIPVWIESRPSEIKWHYSKPTKVRRDSKLEEHPIWHYRGWYTKSGEPICDNKWVDANSLRADDGIKEIHKKFEELCPDAMEKYEQWNKTGAPDASHFFPPVGLKEIA